MMKITTKNNMNDLVPVGVFNAALWKRYQEGKIRNVYPLSKYNDILQKIKTIEENPPCNMPGEYYLLRKFIVVNVEGTERLSNKPENGSTTENDCYETKAKFYIALEEIYKYIDDAHKTTKHGGRDRIVRFLHSQGIVNVTRDTVELFLSFCKVCRPRRKETHRKISAKNVIPLSTQNDSCDSPVSLSNESENIDSLTLLNNSVATDTMKFNFNDTICDSVCSFTRGYIDLLDFNTTPDGDYRFIFVYIDIETCFCMLYPVRCKCTHELVSHLISIFTLIGTPQVLHSGFDKEFLLCIIQELKNIWASNIIVCGSENYSEVQVVAEKCVSELHDMLKVWLSENNSRNWSFGLKFIQLRKNTKFIGDSTKTPYECFFGRSLKGLNLSSSVDTSLLVHASDEDDLLKLISEQKNTNECENLQVSVDPKICSLVQNNRQQSDLISEAQQPDSEDPIIHTSIIKVEPVSDEEIAEENSETSESSSDMLNSPQLPIDTILVKKEVEDGS